MVSFLKIFLGIVWLFMVYRVAATSVESNLFKEWLFWALFAVMLLWAVLFFTLGSIGTIGYTLIQLFELKEGEEIQNILQHNLAPTYAKASVGRPGPSPGRRGGNSKFT